LESSLFSYEESDCEDESDIVDMETMVSDDEDSQQSLEFDNEEISRNVVFVMR
jgi:hypothetical protein